MRAWSVIVLFALTSSTAAEAQDRPRAEALFVEAAEAREAGRWEEARALLEESLEIFAHFPTAWNLVAALEETNDLAGAETLLERMLAGDFGTLSPAERASVNERLEAVAARLGTVVVSVPPDRGAAVSVEGAEPQLADAAGRVVLRLGPGTRRIHAEAEGQRQSETIEVVAGQSRSVRFTLPDPSAALMVEREPVDDAPIWTSPWLWVGVGLAVVGLAVVTALLLTSGNDAPEMADFMSPPL